MKGKKLYVGVLMYDNVHPVAIANHIQLMHEIAKKYQFKIGMVSATYSSKPKNLFAEYAATTDVDYVFFYNINLMPTISQLDKLLSHEKDVVSALYFDKLTIAPNYKIDQNGKWATPNQIPLNKLVKVASAELGCAVIKNQVFKDLIKKAGENALFDYIYTDNTNALSEDDFFAGLLAEAGNEIFVDTSVRLGQYGGIVDYKYHLSKMSPAMQKV